MATLITGIKYKITRAGISVPGGKIFTYESGTSTPKAVYTDPNGTVPASNPVVTDVNGEAVIYLGTGAYRFQETDSLNVPIGGPVDGIGDASGTGTVATNGANRNVQISSTGTNALVSITADQVLLQSASGNTIVVQGVVQSINTASLGAGGLDVGSLAASTWYYVWVAANAAGTTVTACISASFTSPSLPGYTYFVRLGSIRTDGTANRYPFGFKQKGIRVQYAPLAGSNLTALPTMASGIQGNVATPTWFAVALANFVPPTAGVISVCLGIGSAGGTCGAAPNNAYGSSSAVGSQPPLLLNTSAASGATSGDFVIESTNIYYYSSAAATQLQAFGWSEQL